MSAAVLVCGTTHAQQYPAKPIRFVLPFGAPGGAPDITARLLAPKLTEALGQQIVIEPRVGAGGTIGTEVVANAAPDGYTILLTSPSHAINVTLYPKLAYDAVADFVPITQLVEVPNILVVHPSLPARTVKELIALARAKPGSLNYGSAGSGSSQHLAGELFKKMAHVDMVHIPYKGGGGVVVDLIAGQLQLTFGSATSLPYVRSGRLIALAVTSAQRASTMPALPTISEAGLPGYEASAWYALFAPARTPKPIIDKLHAEVTRILKLPDVRERLAFETISPVGSTPAELADFLKREIVKWGAIIKDSGARVD
ncbi:MAG: tripartite tricarboxylate transporter substrate binding protein [Burkholderiales bacterium]